MLADLARVRSAIFGGLGIGLVEGVGEWDPIAEALLAEDPGSIADEKGRMFRAFADQTGSDRKALAACIRTSRTTLTPAELAGFDVPVLIGIGTKDEIAGSGEELARLMPNATAIDIPQARSHAGRRRQGVQGGGGRFPGVAVMPAGRPEIGHLTCRGPPLC